MYRTTRDNSPATIEYTCCSDKCYAKAHHQYNEWPLVAQNDNTLQVYSTPKVYYQFQKPTLCGATLAVMHWLRILELAYDTLHYQIALVMTNSCAGMQPALDRPSYSLNLS